MARGSTATSASSWALIKAGSPFFYGVCDAELMWECETTINIVDVESVSWGGIKNLYR